jgi:hypothetical protein
VKSTLDKIRESNNIQNWDSAGVLLAVLDRSSDLIYQSNFYTWREILLAEDLDMEHWEDSSHAIIVWNTADPELLDVVLAYLNRLEDYIILDEEQFSEMEQDAIATDMADWGYDELVNYYDINTDHLSQPELHQLLDEVIYRTMERGSGYEISHDGTSTVLREEEFADEIDKVFAYVAGGERYYEVTHATYAMMTYAFGAMREGSKVELTTEQGGNDLIIITPTVGMPEILVMP